MVHFSWGELIFSQAHLFSALFGFCILSSIIIWNLKNVPMEVAPAQNLSLQAGVEFFTSFIVGVCDSVIGPKGRPMVPVFGSIFLIIWIQNLLTLFPGFTAATDNLNSTLAFGFCSFFLYNYYGVKQHKFSYIRQFLGPLMVIAPFMFCLEIITHFMRPVSLGLRLYGNMMGDHTVLSSFISMVPFGIPVIFYFVALFVCTIQAFVFTMLSMIYYSMAISDDH